MANNELTLTYTLTQVMSLLGKTPESLEAIHNLPVMAHFRADLEAGRAIPPMTRNQVMTWFLRPLSRKGVYEAKQMILSLNRWRFTE